MIKETQKNQNYLRAAELLDRMTLREKVGQLAQNFFGFHAYCRDENNEIILTEEFKAYVLKFGGIGMLNNYFRADPWTKRCYATGGITAEEREKAYNILQKFIIENTRLSIPVLIEEDTPHGRQVLGSVLYPVNFNVGNSFAPSVYQRQTEQIGREAKLGGVHVPYLSCFDMAVDPRWGRSEECFSEDPYLAAAMASSAVRGMKKAGSMVCCKHFAGQGAATGGHNGGVSVIGERELREIHLPAVKAAVSEGCEFIMAAYNEIDGLPCHANPYLLKTVLREELGFAGVVRSDGCANDRLSSLVGDDPTKAAALAISSGVDCGLWDEAYEHLEQAVESGLVSEKIVDDAVLRLLEQKFACGVMDHPYLEENHASSAYLASGEGQKAAYEMAAESLVLLKNEKILPLQKDQKVLLIGENLDNVYCLLGDYTSERRGMKSVRDCFCEASYLEGWRFTEGVTASDQQLREAVEQADVIVFGCGGSSVRDFESDYNDAGAIEKASIFMDCGEGCDLASLQLPQPQLDLLNQLTAFGKPIVSLLICGRAYCIGEVTERSDALLLCGYPGQEGAQAICDAVYGKINRFGRLSVSFPKHPGQLPVTYNQKMRGNYVDVDAKPLFPFGFGLSYSDFTYSDFSVSPVSLEALQNGETIKVRFTVRNDSDRKGAAVPQLYLNKQGGTVTHRLKELCAFEKIEVPAGETRAVELSFGAEALQEWSATREYSLCPMQVTVMLGTSSEEILYQQQFGLK